MANRLSASLSGVRETPKSRASEPWGGRYAAAFPRIRINSVDPGFTDTDFNEHRGTQTVEEGAEVIVRYAHIDGPTGGFFDRNGPEPW